MSERATSPRPILYPGRFDLLDAIRGLAALAVVIDHEIGSQNHSLQLGQPAVMVFFVISGYCIASAADACQRRGFGFLQFMWRRVRRIYPPYLLSLVFWAATRAFKLKMNGINQLARPWTDWLQNLTLTQWLTLVRHPANHAAQNPTLFVTAYWSLDYEEQFYLLFGVALVVVAGSVLRMRAFVAALIVVSVAWIAGFPTLCYGVFIEYWAMFGVGALVFYRLCQQQTAVRRRLADISIVGLLFLSILMRLRAAGKETPVTWIDLIQPPTRVAWDDLAVCSAFGVVLLLIRPLNDWYNRNRWCSLPLGSLGLISYSLYLVHQFNLRFVATAVAWLLHTARIDNPAIALIAVLQCAAQVAIAGVFWYFCERPFLNKSLLAISGSAALAQELSGKTNK